MTNGLATLQRSLGATSAQAQFVLTSYALAYGVPLITGGRLGDLYGRRRIFGGLYVGFSALRAGVVSFVVDCLPGCAGPDGSVAVSAGRQFHSVAGPLLGGVLIDANLFGTSDVSDQCSPWIDGPVVGLTGPARISFQSS